MRRLLFYVIGLAILVAGAVWLADRPGNVSIRWGDYLITTSVAVLVVAVIVLSVVVAVLYRIWVWLRKGPGRMRKSLTQHRREKGYEALTRGLVALAAGDSTEARRFARKADDMLDRPPLTLLLSAQAAQLDGDDKAATDTFEAMVERPETEFLGLRGLMVEALRRGDHEAARVYAKRAHALRPDAVWAAEALFELETRDGDWRAAQRTLESAVDRRALAKPAGKRRRAVVLIERAREALGDLRRADAIKLAREAHAEAPDLVPGAVLLADLLSDEQKFRAAAKVIEQTWVLAPHPDLAKAFLRAGRDEDRIAAYRRLDKLIKAAPNALESHVAAARAALDADLTGEARRHLDDASKIEMTHRIASLYVELEEKDGHADAAQEWLRKAAEAESDEGWQCGSCGHVPQAWAPVCPHCSAFDTLTWTRPHAVARPVTTTALTPLAS
jgi:HemY protein